MDRLQVSFSLESLNAAVLAIVVFLRFLKQREKGSLSLADWKRRRHQLVVYSRIHGDAFPKSAFSRRSGIPPGLQWSKTRLAIDLFNEPNRLGLLCCHCLPFGSRELAMDSSNFAVP